MADSFFLHDDYLKYTLNLSLAEEVINHATGHFSEIDIKKMEVASVLISNLKMTNREKIILSLLIENSLLGKSIEIFESMVNGNSQG
jgi:hypothetical protein